MKDRTKPWWSMSADWFCVYKDCRATKPGIMNITNGGRAVSGSSGRSKILLAIGKYSRYEKQIITKPTKYVVGLKLKQIGKISANAAPNISLDFISPIYFYGHVAAYSVGV